MNVLSVGNSFSQDAQRYLHHIAKAEGYTLNAFNLCIGGASLSLHYRNVINGQREYTLEMNGESTGFKVSLKEALINRDWDVVTIQQVSHLSPYFETYQPYLGKLVEYIRYCVPKAKIALHQTWAYEQDSMRLNKLGYKDHKEMFEDIKKSYEKATEAIKADLLVPSGELFQMIIASGVEKVHRDTFHASLGLGRYALGLLWYQYLTGNQTLKNTFYSFDENISKDELQIVKNCVKTLYKNS